METSVCSINGMSLKKKKTFNDVDMSLLSVSKERGWRDRNKCEPFFGKAQLLEEIWHLKMYLCFLT